MPASLADAAPKGKVLIANRGEIARRVARSCHALGLTPVVVYVEQDALSLHVLEAEEKVCLGASTREYTNAAKLLEAAVSTGYDPILYLHQYIFSKKVMHKSAGYQSRVT